MPSQQNTVPASQADLTAPFPWDGSYVMDKDGISYTLDMGQFDETSLDFHIKATEGGQTTAQLLMTADVDGNTASFDDGQNALVFTLKDGSVQVEHTGQISYGDKTYDFSGLYVKQ